jgi:hypothetical protein
MDSGEESYSTDSGSEELAIEDSGSESSLSGETTSDTDDEVAPPREDEWSEISSTNPPPAPERFPFTGGSSMNFRIDPESGALKYFELFFDDELIEFIVTETNRYASDSLREKAGPSSGNESSWRDVTSSEVRVFLALVMLQSVVRKPDTEFYWSTRPILASPFFGQTMAYRRFVKIRQFLHFSNNANYNPEAHPNPKLNKIWPVYERLGEKFKDLYTPLRDITIDESLLLFKGRLGWRQFMPLKRARFGIKMFILCESRSGYVWSSIIYTGKGTIIDREYAHMPVSSQVVMTLMKPLLGKGYCLTTDNFYTSPELSELLASRLTDSYGTVNKTRRGVPAELKSKRLRTGEVAAFRKGKITILRWRDKKEVTLLSTIHSCGVKSVSKRGKQKEKPVVVLDYNDTMGGVDRVDQHLADYPIPRKRGKKYYKKIFFHLLELAVWNSFVLYRKNGGGKVHLEYRLELIEQLIEAYHPDIVSPRVGRPPALPHPRRLTERHFPEMIEATEKKAHHSKQCYMCARKRDARGKKIRKETRYQCVQCNVSLCVIPCFRNFHTNVNI